MRICVGIPTLCRYDLLVKLMGDLMAQTRRPEMVLIVDNGEGFQKWLADNRVVVFPALNTQVVMPRRNLGAGGGCNLGMKMAFNANFDLYIHMNDDLSIGPDTLERLEKGVIENPNCSFIGVDGLFYTMFGVRPGWLEETGGFDEQFWPAYFEDNDMERRMTLAQTKRAVVDGVTYKHFGSATISSFTLEQRREHDKQFEANRERYVKKWGGPPGQETLPTPYNT